MVSACGEQLHGTLDHRCGRTLPIRDHKAPGNLDLDLEMVLQVGAKAEFWGRILDQQTSLKEADVAGSDSRVMALPAFTQGGCFYANSATSDLFGQAGLEPEMVLKDRSTSSIPRKQEIGSRYISSRFNKGSHFAVNLCKQPGRADQ